MAVDLMSLGQTQGQLEKRYSDYLREKRDLAQMQQQAQQISDVGLERFAGSFGPQGAGAVVNPADIFRQYQTFQTITPNQADIEAARTQQFGTEMDFLNQIAQLAAARQPEGIGLSDQIKAYEAGLEIKDGQLVPRATSGGLTEKQTKDLLDQRATLLSQGLDTTSIDEQLRGVGILKDTGEREDIVALIDEILADQDSINALTGKLRLKGGLNPFAREKVATTEAKLDQLMGFLTLENRQKLRGQGTITDREQKTLEQASTTLGKRDQSTKAYLAELKKLRSDLSEGLVVQDQKESNQGQVDPLGIL